MMERERKLNPNCANAGNPFHECGDHCAKRGINGGGKSPVLKADGIRDERRNVDLNCVNASNPFHQCAEYCVKKSADAKKHGSGHFPFPVLLKISPRSSSDRSNGGRSVLSEGSVGIEGRNVDPNCVNASNPFHQCAEYCTKKTADAKKQVRTVQNGGLGNVEVRKMEQGRKVDPRCVNASNPFHQCTERCSQTASAATRQPNGHTLEISPEPAQILSQEC